jgi:ABC-type transporter Mla subunit MlaD
MNAHNQGNKMFHEHDRWLLRTIHLKLDIIIKTMANDRQALDDALAQQRQDIADAAQRVTDALAAMQTKIDAGQDFSAELATVNELHGALQAIAAAPVTTGTPTGAGASNAGAAGTTVAGPAEHAAIVKAGGEVVDSEGFPGHAGSATVPQITPPPPDQPPAEEPTNPS